jgi:hypothetical protein
MDLDESYGTSASNAADQFAFSPKKRSPARTAVTFQDDAGGAIDFDDAPMDEEPTATNSTADDGGGARDGDADGDSEARQPVKSKSKSSRSGTNASRRRQTMKMLQESRDYEVLPEDDTDDAPSQTVKRASRVRLPPLQWWKGEDVVYRRAAKGPGSIVPVAAAVKLADGTVVDVEELRKKQSKNPSRRLTVSTLKRTNEDMVDYTRTAKKPKNANKNARDDSDSSPKRKSKPKPKSRKNARRDDERTSTSSDDDGDDDEDTADNSDVLRNALFIGDSLHSPCFSCVRCCVLSRASRLRRHPASRRLRLCETITARSRRRSSFVLWHSIVWRNCRKTSASVPRQR